MQNIGLTKTQLKTAAYVASMLKRKGRLPTIKEIMTKFKLNSSASAWDRLNRFKRKKELLGVCPFCNKPLD